MFKKCEWCGKEMTLTKEQERHGQRFCSCSCSAKWRNHTYGPNRGTEESRKKHRESAKRQWQNPGFRKSVIERMINNNPTRMPGVALKIRQKRLQNGTYYNNWSYGNGKISPSEQEAMRLLAPLGFYYNYAISCKEARHAFPDRHYAKSYKPDFVNLALKVCIEIDGKTHDSQYGIEQDAKKRECLGYYGFSVYHFKNEEVFADGFLERVKKLCGLN